MNGLAILVAAGQGERMRAGRPKAFVELAGRPLLVWSALAFEAAPSIDQIVVVVPREQVDLARELLRPVSKLLGVVEGGERRQDSVEQGLRLVPRGFDGLVLVHDAARPLVREALVEAVGQAAAEVGAAVPVVPLVDTIKSLSGGRVTGTVDRSALGAAQTPQGFRYPLLREAYDAAYRDRVTVTDEAMAVERLGRPVAAVPGAASNRKLTTPEDLAWAEDLLAREAQA
jgi:2-C-methyl-D-erythritol 4-phosphate cytidylyltransferase